MEATDVSVGIENRPIITSKRYPCLVRFHTSGLICGITREKSPNWSLEAPPSMAVECSSLRNIHNASHLDAIHSNRPVDQSRPPIQIYYPAFATFIRESEDLSSLQTILWTVPLCTLTGSTISWRGTETREGFSDKLRTAVQTLHSANFVHCDLRGPNILVTEDGGMRIVDF